MMPAMGRCSEKSVEQGLDRRQCWIFRCYGLSGMSSASIATSLEGWTVGSTLSTVVAMVVPRRKAVDDRHAHFFII